MKAWIPFWPLAALVVLILLCACAHRLPHRPRWESYDQENLQAPQTGRHNPCPGVYDAPNGELHFCQ